MNSEQHIHDRPFTEPSTTTQTHKERGDIMRVRFSFILDIENDDGGLCRIQEVAHAVASDFDCNLSDDKRDQLACVERVKEWSTK